VGLTSCQRESHGQPVGINDRMNFAGQPTSDLAVEAAETAKAMLKNLKGEDMTQTSAGVLLQLSLKGVPAGEHAFHIHAVASASLRASTRLAGILIRATRAMEWCQGRRYA
jgi:Cu/Zn superoxide dismutase